MNAIISGQTEAEASINSKFWEGLSPNARLIMVVTLVIFVFFVRKLRKNAEKFSKYGISLPIDPNLKKNHLIKICKVLNSL